MIIIYWVDIFLVLSNAVFFLPSYEAFKRRRRLRSLIYFFMAWASAFYHTCLSFDACLFEFEFHHYLDFFFAQFIIVVAGSYLIVFDDQYRYLEYWFLASGALGIVILEYSFPGQFLVQAGIVTLLFLILVVYWVVCALRKKLPKYHWNVFVAGLALTAGSITLFIFQDSWYQAYWLIHSVWHIAAAFGQYYLLQIKDAGPYTIPAAERIKRKINR